MAQYVTLVANGGTPIRLADQYGAPFPTTGYGPLVFANGPTLSNVTFVDGNFDSITTSNETLPVVVGSNSATFTFDDAQNAFWPANSYNLGTPNHLWGNVYTVATRYDGHGPFLATMAVGPTLASNTSISLPGITDTLVGRVTTDTLVNKTLTNPIIGAIKNGGGTLNPNNAGTITVPNATDTLIGSTTTDTLTHKTLTSPTINGGIISGATITGGIVTGDVLVSPTISGGTISGATISGGTISGATISGGTIISAAHSGGTISGATISGTTTVASGAIISLGSASTLTGAVGATITLSGSLAVSGSIQVGSSGGITAHAGGGRASATNLNLPLSEITTVASAGDSVALLSAGGGVSQVVVNANVTNSITVFTRNGTSDTINALTSTTSFPVAAGKTAVFYNPTVGKWYGGSLT